MLDNIRFRCLIDCMHRLEHVLKILNYLGIVCIAITINDAKLTLVGRQTCNVCFTSDQIDTYTVCLLARFLFTRLTVLLRTT